MSDAHPSGQTDDRAHIERLWEVVEEAAVTGGIGVDPSRLVLVRADDLAQLLTDAATMAAVLGEPAPRPPVRTVRRVAQLRPRTWRAGGS